MSENSTCDICGNINATNVPLRGLFLCDSETCYQEMGLCGFDQAYLQRCDNAAKKKKGYCEKHDRQCTYDKCRNKSRKECVETEQFVCGTPICNRHSMCKYHTEKEKGFQKIEKIKRKAGIL